MFVYCITRSICRGGIHIAGNTGVSVPPPSTSNTRSSFKYAKLVEIQLLLKLATHGNPRFTSADDSDGVVSIPMSAVCTMSAYGGHVFCLQPVC